MLGQGDLTRAVAFVHAADLRHRDVALVDDAQEVLRKIIDKRIRRLARSAAVNMARIVLNAAAEAHGLEHLKIVAGAHLEALCFKKLALGTELLEAVLKLLADACHGTIELRARSDVMRSRPNGKRFVRLKNLTRDVVHFRNGLDLVTPELDADGVVGVRRKHVQVIAAHAESPARKLVIVSIVLNVDEIVDDIIAVGRFFLVKENRHARIIHRRTDTVDAAYRRNHDAITTREQSGRGRMTEFLDFLVDRCILLDKRVRSRDVCFGLIVVVVRNEVDNRVVGEELLQLARQLGCKRLVGGKHQRGLLRGLDDFSHSEGFARAGNAQKGLIAHAVVNILGKRLDGLGLIACRLVRRNNLERRVGKPYVRQLAFHSDTFEIRKMSHCECPLEHDGETEKRRRARTGMAPRHSNMLAVLELDALFFSVVVPPADHFVIQLFLGAVVAEHNVGFLDALGIGNLLGNATANIVLGPACGNSALKTNIERRQNTNDDVGGIAHRRCAILVHRILDNHGLAAFALQLVQSLDEQLLDARHGNTVELTRLSRAFECLACKGRTADFAVRIEDISSESAEQIGFHRLPHKNVMADLIEVKPVQTLIDKGLACGRFSGTHPADDEDCEHGDLLHVDLKQ